MICIYQANSGIDAHLVRGLLLAREIPCAVLGEHLQGAMGELPALGLIRVVVDPCHEDAARRIVEEFQANRVAAQPDWDFDGVEEEDATSPAPEESEAERAARHAAGQLILRSAGILIAGAVAILTWIAWVSRTT